MSNHYHKNYHDFIIHPQLSQSSTFSTPHQLNSAMTESCVFLSSWPWPWHLSSLPPYPILTSAMTMSCVFLIYCPSVFTTVCRNLIYWTCRPCVSMQWTKCCMTLSVISLASASLSWNMAVQVWVSNSCKNHFQYNYLSNIPCQQRHKIKPTLQQSTVMCLSIRTPKNN